MKAQTLRRREFGDTHIAVLKWVVQLLIHIQWNPSIVATVGERLFGHYRGVVTSQGFFVFMQN